jgi:cytidine deaminase
MIQTLTLHTIVRVYDSLLALPTDEQDLLLKAREACNTAYAPYSNFHVGAAILLADGTVVTGSNQENLAYPSGLCAERTAIYYTGANHKGTPILKIAVAAFQPSFAKYMPANPCGACRQALLEYENKQPTPIRVILEGEKNKVYVVDSVECLLPLRFKAEFMGLVE